MRKRSGLIEEKGLEALREVQDPELGKSSVELGMVHDVQLKDG
jgi:metal-sulfur cluster biosynthetic enzyme